MSTSGEPWQPILDRLSQLRDAWPAQGWSWDHRFKCATSSLGTDAALKAKAILLGVVPTEWDARSFARAPDLVRGLAERCGEIRSGQALLTAEPLEGMLLFAMWWPWGDGATISIRIGVAECDRPKELYPLIRSVFGIV
jgi:hypothetical protein